MTPDPERVLRRARALAAIGHRGLIERDRDRARAERVRAAIRGWAAAELGEEPEPAERARLDAAIGALAPEDTIASVERFEGAIVLAWALRLVPLPPHDRVADVAALSEALAVGRPMPPGERALRSGRELDRARERAFAVHWRLSEQRLRPGTIDLAAFARTAWFGPLELDPAMLLEGDLVIGGAPIARADPIALGRTAAIARERHQALNWLSGDDPIYSEVDVATSE